MLKLDEKMSPELKILVYGLVDDEVVADSMSIELTRCLSHQVNLTLEDKSLRVGKRASIEIQSSEPNSICALSAIDKSVTFMGTRNTVDLAKVKYIVIKDMLILLLIQMDVM